MKKVYVVRQETTWDPDFVAVYPSVKKLVQGLCEIFKEEDIFLDETTVLKQIKTREEVGALYLFFPDEYCEYIKDNPRYLYLVQAVYMDN